MALRFAHNEDGVLTWVEEAEDGNGGSSAFVGGAWIVDSDSGNPLVVNDLIPWGIEIYDTDGLMTDPDHKQIVCPAGKGGIWRFGAILYVNSGPAGIRPDPLDVGANISAVIEEPSGSCDMKFIPTLLVYDGTAQLLFAQGSFDRPWRDGDTADVFLGGGQLAVNGGLQQSWFTATRVGDLPTLNPDQYPPA